MGPAVSKLYYPRVYSEPDFQIDWITFFWTNGSNGSQGKIKWITMDHGKKTNGSHWITRKKTNGSHWITTPNEKKSHYFSRENFLTSFCLVPLHTHSIMSFCTAASLMCPCFSHVPVLRECRAIFLTQYPRPQGWRCFKTMF